MSEHHLLKNLQGKTVVLVSVRRFQTWLAESITNLNGQASEILVRFFTCMARSRSEYEKPLVLKPSESLRDFT
jgi:hypothetical protein